MATPAPMPAGFLGHGSPMNALERNRFNQRQTAEALGLGYHQLRGLLKKHGLIGKPD